MVLKFLTNDIIDNAAAGDGDDYNEVDDDDDDNLLAWILFWFTCNWT